LQTGEWVIINAIPEGKLSRIDMMHKVLSTEDSFPSSSAHTMVEVFGKIYSQVILFGILSPKKEYFACDLLVNKHYMHWEAFADICIKQQVKTLPVLAQIPYHLSTVQKVSQVYKQVVIRPLRERTHPDCGRVIFKHIRANL